MTTITNVETLRQYKSRFFLTVELVLALAFNSSSNMVREVKNLSLNFNENSSTKHDALLQISTVFPVAYFRSCPLSEVFLVIHN